MVRIPFSRAATGPGKRGPTAAGSMLLAVLAAGSVSDGATAQVVQGRLVDPRERVGIGGAMMSIVLDDDRRLASSLTRGSGLFEITAPSAGRYRLKAERIGYAATWSDHFEITAGDTLTVNLAAQIEAISLAAIEVEGDGRCRVRPEEGLAVTRVWDEARKALDAALWTQERGLYQYEMMGVSRELDEDGRRVISEDRTFQRGYSRSPYVSRAAELLVEEGFARLSTRGSTYWAPDAAVLLSDPFLDTHCFRLRSDDRRAPGLIGLAFEPVPGRRLPEIEGTLWLDPADSQLKWLDFRYLNLGLPDAASSAAAGGRVEFRAMPNGTWIVDSWRIRMPRVEGFVNPLNGTRGVRLAGVAEQGGDVLRAHGNEEAVFTGDPGRQILGVVFDSLQQGLAGARVFLEGTDVVAFAGQDGRFEISGLRPGTYAVNFSHPYLERYGFRPRPFDIDVPEEARTPAQVNFAAPTVWRIVDRLCREEERAEEAADPAPGRTADQPGILTGEVLDERGNPQHGVAVRILSRDYAIWRGVPAVQVLQNGLIVTTNEQGVYRACGVPVDADLAVAVLKPGWDLESGRPEGDLVSDRAIWRDGIVRVPSGRPLAVLDFRVEPRPGSR